MIRSRLAILLSALLGFVLLGILIALMWPEDKTPRLPHRYGFNRESASWNPEVWINGQPALRLEGHGSILFWDSTHFVMDGENEVRISAVRSKTIGRGFESMPPGFSFSEQTRAEDRIEHKEMHRFTIPNETGSELINESFTFTASVPLRWKWQNADDLGDLSAQDRTDILALFHQLADAIRRYDAKQVRSLFADWQEGPSPRVQGEDVELSDPWDTNMDLLRGNPVFVTADSELQFILGSKVVMLFCPGIEERFGGPDERPLVSSERVVPVGINEPPGTKWEKQRETILQQLQFIRLNGRWCMLSPSGVKYGH